MLTCSNCGATIREGAKFCTSCGTRLNDTANAPTTNVWAVPAPSPEPSATVASPAIDETGIVDAAQVSDDAISSTGNAETTAGTDGFSWSWGSPVTADADDSGNRPQGDDESGVVLPEDNTSEATTAEAIADSTELEILDGQPSTSDETLVDGIATAEADGGPAADISAVIDDATASVEEDESTASPLADNEQDDTNTLAAWAGEWETSEVAVDEDEGPDVVVASDEEEQEPEAEAEANVADDAAVTGTANDTGDLVAESDAERETEFEPVSFDAAAVTLAANDSSAAAAERTSDDHESAGESEDTVARAERLIGELKAIIPTLARPRPALPERDDDAAQTVANDLESAAQVGQFDDVREALLAARDHPRDVDNMLRLSNNVDRLLELLDDRNNLAKTATSAAGRLRKGTKAAEV